MTGCVPRLLTKLGVVGLVGALSLSRRIAASLRSPNLPGQPGSGVPGEDADRGTSAPGLLGTVLVHYSTRTSLASTIERKEEDFLLFFHFFFFRES